jgi:hypothetical protein
MNTLAATPSQHQISLIYKHENQIIHNYNNIQQLIKNIIGGFEIDIFSVSRLYQGFKRGRRTNRSFG